MNRNALYGTIAVGAIGGSLVLWQLSKDDATAANSASDDAAAPAERSASAVASDRASAAAAPPISMQPLSIDDDPTGPLRLEGIVLGDRDAPVPGAVVYLSSNPPRTTTAGDDGTFEFDKLVGRMYSLSARADDSVGGPVIHRLTVNSDPVAIRVRVGARLKITVVTAGTGEPIEGATVGVYGEGGPSARTDRDGLATLAGVGRGGHIVYAEASGYGRQREIVQIPETADVMMHQRLELARGAAVSGRVVDPNGKPVAEARVMATNAGAFAPMDPDHDSVKTGDDGQFTLPAVRQGTFRFVALHAKHPPSSTEMLQLDGATERTDVVIVMEMGGILAGRVVDSDGAAAPWATVRVGSDPDATASSADTRQVVAAEDGTFRLEGVARKPLAAVATSDVATSQLVRFDLRKDGDRGDLLLTLDIGGMIAGSVVDETGEPLAELQVTAFPDITKGQSIDELALRGPAVAVTDGGGRFSIRGLPDGAYQLRAARDVSGQSAFLRKGVSARTGDTEVRILLPADGGLEGRARFADGSTPELMTASVTGTVGVPANKGVFRVDALPAGTYDVTLRGPDFTEKVLRDVTVEPGAMKDIGDIEIERGRSVRGRVVDRRGRPVAGASVVYGKQLLGTGESMTLDVGQQLDEQLGVRRVTATASGEFRVPGISNGAAVIAAEHSDRGRSHPVDVAAGDDDVTVELALVPLGAIEGIVTHNGEPAGAAGLILGSTASGRQSIRAQTGPDGSFGMQNVPAGTYKLTAAIGSGLSATMTSKGVDVVADETARVEIDLRTGNVTVDVVIKGVEDKPIDAAQVFLFEGVVKVSTAPQLMKAFNNPANQGSANMAIAFMPKAASFSKTAPGDYSACVIPINGDMSDPKFGQRLQSNIDALLVYCQPVTVAESPSQQQVLAVVPQMAPLPE